MVVDLWLLNNTQCSAWSALMSLWNWMAGVSLFLPPRGTDGSPNINVSVDSSRHEVVVTSGPFDHHGELQSSATGLLGRREAHGCWA
jgi:hypothetical protein